MNNIQLILGDSLEFMKQMPNDSVDLIVTDPPYDVAIGHKGGSLNNPEKRWAETVQIIDDENLNKGYDIELFGNEFIRIMKDINIYLWCNKTQIPKYFDFYVTKHKCKFEFLHFIKNNCLPNYNNKYCSDTEYCLYFRKGTNKCQPKSYDDARTYYFAPINQKDKKKWNHPTIKPYEFVEKMIRNSSKEGQIVFDPFMGSGTTAVACKKNNRAFLGVEIKKEYLNIAKERVMLGE